MVTWCRAAVLALSLSTGMSGVVVLGASAFAAPEIIVANGGPLTRRIVLSDFAENHRLMLADVEVPPVREASLRVRPRIRLAMYWGVHWKGRLDLPDSVSRIALLEGAQGGAFYPAFRGQPALLQFAASGAALGRARGVAPAGLAILAQHGIPITIR